MVLQFFLTLGTFAGIGGGILWLFHYLRNKDRETQTEIFNTEIAKIKQEAKSKNKLSLIRSKQIMQGKAAEQLAPYLKDFPYNPNDIQFLGAPIDYVAFIGSTLEDVSEIVFLEMKSGNAALTKKQKSIRKTIKKGNVRFEEYRIETDAIENIHIEEMGVDCVCDACY